MLLQVVLVELEVAAHLRRVGLCDLPGLPDWLAKKVTSMAGETAWVADATGGVVRRVDLLTRRALGAPIPVGALPAALTVDGGELFVLCRGDRTLVRIDATRGRVIGRVRVLPDPTAMAVDARYLWVAGGRNEVMRVDR